ncbi:MAG: methylmalonyl Co-A mutase-associated GTPase MeaB [Deltaproteobacteria bacterium]|nr:MAG: methylmalonyl Co-A mutase-associated GTPase MeaB [Deltaproteobacteria bacterium]
MSEQLAQKVIEGDVRALARLLRLIDDGVAEGKSVLKRLYAHTGKARIIGITGNPGAGKSTLVDALLEHYRRLQLKVAVVAIDPTSPFSGGAILGDRIRMQRHATDPGVFIRSFATRGHLGGLTSTTPEVIQAFDAAGWEVVIVETVGVGQDEVDIQRLAQTTVVVMAPGMGDEIQAIKAGVLEIADIFVVNKADREGAHRTVRELRNMLELDTGLQQQQHEHERSFSLHDRKLFRVTPAGWKPAIVKTVAVRGEGISELAQQLEQHKKLFDDAMKNERFRKARLRQQFLDIFRRTLFSRGWSYLMHADHLEQIVDKILKGESDPYSLAEEAARAVGSSV